MAEQQLVSPFDFATAGSVYDSIDPPARFTESPMASPSMSCVEEGREGDDLFTLVTRKLSFLKFDSAKELCEKEEKASSQGSVWHTFSSILFHLAQAEKGYFSFSFLEKSWAFMPVKKEPQKGTVQYDLALHQLPLLKKLVDSERDSLESPTVEDFLTIARHLPYFVQTRGQLIEFYAALYSKGRTYIDSDQANKDLYSISQGIKKSLQPDYLVHLRNLLHKEVTLLQELLKTNSLIAQWDYLPSLLQLESIQARLLKWCGVNPLHTMSDRKPGGLLHKSLHPSPIPLYQWICKLYTTLLAKFSLYFNCVLSENATDCDLQNLSEKLEPDFVSRIRAALLQTSLKCVCLLFNTNGLSDFRGPGYHLPNTPTLELQGISSFPLMLKVPQNFNLAPHMPNVVSLVFQVESSTKPGQAIFEVDEKKSSAYHVLKVDPRVYMVGVCASSKSGKNTKAQNTLSEIGSLLRLSQVVGLLKSV